MATPFQDLVAEIRKLGNLPKITYPYGDMAFPVTERVLKIKRGASGHVGTLGDPDPDATRFAGMKLVEHVELEADAGWVTCYRKWEIIPSKAVTTTRQDQDGKTLTTTTQRILTADIVTEDTVTPPSPSPYVWTRKYKGEGDGYVAAQITETRAIPGNAVPEKLRDKIRGPFTRTTQLVRTADAADATVAEALGIVTETTYQSVPGTILVMNKVIETYALATCVPLTTPEYDPESDTFVLVTRTLKKTSSISKGITLVTAAHPYTITLINSEPNDSETSFEIATIWTEPVARDSATQITVSEEDRPMTFPNVVKNLTLWADSDGAMGIAKSFVARVPHVKKRYWAFASTKPAVARDELRPVTIDNVVGTGPMTDMITDAGSYTLATSTLTIPASTPTATAYASGYIGGSTPKVVNGSARMDGNCFRFLVEREYVQYIEQGTATYS